MTVDLAKKPPAPELSNPQIAGREVAHAAGLQFAANRAPGGTSDVGLQLLATNTRYVEGVRHYEALVRKYDPPALPAMGAQPTSKKRDAEVAIPSNERLQQVRTLLLIAQQSPEPSQLLSAVNTLLQMQENVTTAFEHRIARGLPNGAEVRQISFGGAAEEVLPETLEMTANLGLNFAPPLKGAALLGVGMLRAAGRAEGGLVYVAETGIPKAGAVALGQASRLEKIAELSKLALDAEKLSDIEKRVSIVQKLGQYAKDGGEGADEALQTLTTLVHRVHDGEDFIPVIAEAGIQLAKTDTPAARAAVQQFLRETLARPNSQWNVLRSLAEHSPHAFELFKDCVLTTQYGHVQSAAITWLCRMDDPAAKGLLKQLLREADNVETRVAVVTQTGREAFSTEVLEVGLGKGQDMQVRLEAARQLADKLGKMDGTTEREIRRLLRVFRHDISAQEAYSQTCRWIDGLLKAQ